MPGAHSRASSPSSSRTATTPSCSPATAPTPRTPCSADVVDGVGPDEDAERLTHERIRAYAAETPTVYLAAHDPETAARLAERRRDSAPREDGDRVIEFETGVSIRRPVEDVFAFVSEPLHFPRWNSAVRAVRATSAARRARCGSTYSMERDLPSGRAENEIEIFVREPPCEFAMRTTSGPTPFVYHYRFSPEAAGRGSSSRPARTRGRRRRLGPLAARAVKRGVDDNLATLKGILA